MNFSIRVKLIFIVVFFFTPIRVFATDCSISMEYKEAVIESDEIFVGRLLKVKPVKYLEKENGPPGTFDSGWFQYELVFDIERKWKGNGYNRISIFIDNLCPPAFNLTDSSYFWLHPFNRDILDYSYIIYAARGKSRLEEIIIRSTSKSYDNFELPGYRMTSGSNFRTLGTKNPTSDSLYNSEIAKLDSTFTQPITLVPYFLNPKYFIYLFLLAGTMFFLGKKLKRKPSS